MSSRRRTNRSVKVSHRREVAAAAVPGCQCAVCDGEIVPLRRLFAPALADLSGIDEADELEVACSTLFGMMWLVVGEDDAPHGWTQVVLPMLRQQGTSQTAAVLRTIGALGGGQVETAADRELEQLVANGIRPPTWVEALRQPVTATDLRAYEDPEGSTWLLAGRLSRAGTAVGLVMAVDPEDCAALQEVWMVEGEEFSGVLERMRTVGPRTGTSSAEVLLDAAEWRWRAEAAMDARDAHDLDDLPDEVDAFEELSNGDGDGPGWRAMAAMLRFWIGKLPDPGKPKPTHGDGETTADALNSLKERFAAGAFSRGSAASAPDPYRPSPPAPVKLANRRKKSDGTAPLYRLRVDVRGAKPPIWRRLEVAGDTTLAELHGILQIAFGWDDYHMHCFETDFGTFGHADADLGHRPESNVTLEQVVSDGGRITYTYDFGDGWDHLIAVESVNPPQEGIAYPRCTAGRRAAPPEDCGGIWGYADLCEVLADPEDDEHADRLEWLGLADASEFDPAAFDVAETDRALRSRR